MTDISGPRVMVPNKYRLLKESFIKADSFILHPRGFRIYRVKQENAGTVLWLSQERMLKHLAKLQAERLLVRIKDW